MNHNHSVADGRAFAFLLLDDCELEMQGIEKPMTLGQWMDVQLVVDEGYAHQKSKACERCLLVLQMNDNQIFLSWDRIQVADGYLGKSNHTCPYCDKNRRSDASLLMGLVKFCSNMVAVESCRVFFRSHNRGSLVLNIDFPLLDTSAPVGRRSILGENPDKTKRLHVATQTILAMLRSDWNFLCFFMEELKRLFARNMIPEILLSRAGQTIFPSDLSAETLYSHVNGSPLLSQVIDNWLRYDCDRGSDQCIFTTLSTEILCDSLAPFLQSNSLNSLRSTCSYLYHTLHAIAPGLKLRLFSHQRKSLVWMRAREAMALKESTLRQLTSRNLYSIEGDAHRAATGGSTVLLIPRPAKGNHPANDCIRINQLTGNEIEFDPDNICDRTVARGGLLCDEPGCGKTITVLALILQTAGMLPSCRNSKAETENDNDLIFQTYWQEQFVLASMRKEALLRLINSFFRKSVVEQSFCPLPVKEIRRLTDDDRCVDFRVFELGVRKYIQSAANGDSISDDLLNKFGTIVAEFKANQLQSARKSFSNASAKPNSRVAALIAADTYSRFMQHLVRSRATLLVVPAVLMDHWEEQFRRHVNVKYLTSRKPLIFQFGDAPTDSESTAQLLANLDNWEPLLFLDRGGTRRLPCPEFLARFHIVITTTNRFANEWKHGNMMESLRAGFCGRSCDDVCPILKVHWKRMVIDEGHSMAKGNETSSIQFASWVAAERRWAMTGTPTKHNSLYLSQARALFRFLQHDFFSAKGNGDYLWKSAIGQQWRDGSMASFFRLRSLFQFLMKRHAKTDIRELPCPVFCHSVVKMSLVEVNTYNTLVAGVQSNILITSMDAETSGFQDSLLHVNNARHAREALANIRRVCVGWSRVVPTLSEKHWNEMMEACRDENNGLDEMKIQLYIQRAESEELSTCEICSIGLSTLLVMPCCSALICSECMDSNSKICLLCDGDFDVDYFQRVQPGFTLTWKSNLRRSTKSIRDSSSRVHEGTLHDTDTLDGNIVERHQTHTRPTRRINDGHVCEFKRDILISGPQVRCIHCREEHSSCNLLNEERQCEVCGRRAEDCPEDESKSHYLVSKLLELHAKWRDAESPSLSPRHVKAIVFSQFRRALDVVGDRLLKRFGTACVAEYWGKYRRQELHKFTHEKECICLLLTKDGSEGLDLSLATHIFFLEEIWDKALEDQAIARAWRMGAQGSVKVETILAQNSVEETMRQSQKRDLSGILLMEDDDKIMTNHEERDRSRTKDLLLSLRFLTDHHALTPLEPTFVVPCEPPKDIAEPATKKRKGNKVTFFI